MEQLRLLNELHNRRIITAAEYNTAVSRYLENLGPDETRRIFADSELCPHFFQKYPEGVTNMDVTNMGVTHFCQFCGIDLMGVDLIGEDLIFKEK